MSFLSHFAGKKKPVKEVKEEKTAKLPDIKVKVKKTGKIF
jgi:hypothetical protein